MGGLFLREGGMWGEDFSSCVPFGWGFLVFLSWYNTTKNLYKGEDNYEQ